MLPYSSCNLPEQRPRGGPCVVPIWSCSWWGLPCHLCCQRRGALLPHPFTLTSEEAVYFLRHFPSGHPGRTLSGTMPLWSPDFPQKTSLLRLSGCLGFIYKENGANEQEKGEGVNVSHRGARLYAKTLSCT